MRLSRYAFVVVAIAVFASSTDAATAVHLVSWNVHGPVLKHSRIVRMHAVVDEVRRRDPDFILLQEVWFRSDAALFAHAFEPLGYVRIEKKSHWPHHLSGLLIFVSTKRGWSVENGYDFQQYHRHAAWWRVWEADGLGRKGILRQNVKKGDTRLAVIVTHTQAQYGRRDYCEIRGDQVNQLLAYTKRLDPSIPFILAGDFNTAPTGSCDGPIYQTMTTAWTELTKDAREECLNEHDPRLVEPRACGSHWEDDGRLSNEWIDYVFTRLGDDVRAVKVELIRNQAEDWPFSDHEGVDAELLVP